MDNKKFRILKILVTIVSFAAAIFAKSNIDYSHLLNNRLDCVLAKEFLYDLFIGIFSAMILVFFIDGISERMNQKKILEKEKQEIGRIQRAIRPYIYRYILLFYCVVTPYTSRDFQNIEMPKQFELKDMCDLHKYTKIMGEGISGSSIDRFLDIELTLRNLLTQYVGIEDFEYYPNIYELFAQYIELSLKYDNRGALNEVKYRKYGNIDCEIVVCDAVKNDSDEFYRRFKSGEDQTSNILHPYVQLYEMMKQERDIITRYMEEVDKI